MNIEIQGLNSKQRTFADVIWACQDRDQVWGFINSLPGKDRKDAEVVLNMIIAAVFDESTEILPETVEVLQRIRLTGD